MAFTLQDDMDDIFLNSGFEETITYTPSGGTARDISAIVFRDAVKEEGGRRGNMRTNDIEIEISTDATNGVATVTTNEDTVSLSRRIGESAATMSVAGIVHNDAGNWRLRLR